MGSKISGAFHDIKTALIGDRKATDLRQEQIIDQTILPTQQHATSGTIITEQKNLHNLN